MRHEIGRAKASQKIRNNWAVEPGVTKNENYALIFLRLGNIFEVALTAETATAIADALVDAIEDEQVTVFLDEKRASVGRKRTT